MEQMRFEEDGMIRLQEAAQLLGVSGATVRNWQKAGRLTALTEGRKPLFDKKAVLALQEELFTENSQRLKQRRNKAAAFGTIIPSGYVRSTGYVELARQIVQLVEQTGGPVRTEVILAEIALQLLVDRGHIEKPDTSGRNDGLLAAVIQGSWQLGAYAKVVGELFGFTEPTSNYEQSVLRRMLRFPVRFIEGEDLLGLLYMSLSNLRQRKPQGSYYTPAMLAQKLVDTSLAMLEATDGNAPTVVDPCCGSGNFLIHTFLALRASLLRSGMQPAEAELLLRERCLTGYDVDPVAVKLARLNLALLAARYETEEAVNYRIEQRNTLDKCGERLPVFDLVIGNPPWGYRFTNAERLDARKTYASAKTSVESFSLFMERGLDLLDEGGIMAFLLPEAALQVHMHRAIRQILLDRTRVERIEMLGTPFSRVYAPAITLTVRQGAPSPDHQVVVEEGENVYRVAQGRFADNGNFAFNVQATDREYELLESMKQLPGAMLLNGQAEFALGIVTGNNSRYVLAEKPPEGELVLKGSRLCKYNCYPDNSYLVFKPEQFQQTASEHVYRAPEKLLYRFVSEQLVFAYDDSGLLSLNSANIVIPAIPGYAVKYVMAVLNSRPIQFFYTRSFSSVKVLRGFIEALPIPPCSPEKQQEIVSLAETLMEQKKAAARLAVYERIDEHIMELFQLSESDRQLIRKSLPDVKFLTGQFVK